MYVCVCDCVGGKWRRRGGGVCVCVFMYGRTAVGDFLLLPELGLSELLAKRALRSEEKFWWLMVWCWCVCVMGRCRLVLEGQRKEEVPAFLECSVCVCVCTKRGVECMRNGWA